MTDTLHLGLPLIAAAQAQKHVTHNEALVRLDALVMLAVLDRDLSAPPAAPAEGDRYLVAAPGSGDFAGRDDQVAQRIDGGWVFHPPGTGWVCYVADEGMLVVWTGTAWMPVLEAAAGAALQNLARLGVGTAADAGNPFSARLNNVLLTAARTADGGDGSLRLKVEKESTGATASLLFQDGFSGRAEIGLAGDDDLRVKVSPDGASWIDAIRVDRTTGRIAYPASGGPREVLTSDRTYWVRTDGANTNDGRSDTPSGAFLTFQHAVDVVRTRLDLAGFQVTVRAGGAGGTFTGGVSVNGPLVGARGVDALVILGDTTMPANFVLQTTDAGSVVRAYQGAQFSIAGFKLTSTSGVLIDALHFGFVKVTGRMEFGGTAAPHVFARRMGMVELSSIAYVVSGGGQFHLRATNNSIVTVQSSTVTITGTPAFTAFLSMSFISEIISIGATFTGTVSGLQYAGDTNSALINGATPIPGAGSSSSTGFEVS
ncbi:DUF2793 domain-containing protein [Rhodoplanes sp. TEM]|uniref:DUF2793 domain-containing protein n=1 Tax=Rhodoplanes tepidamans TaxID=200616 RepID=A0ABT5JGZ5_RHOTP|nr:MULTISPECIES: DUF2793 domain-containing protein [Rhodoplanes]MDC7788688.1 DUF2793 domain-containing protein [Rhodoplanes tepidamans]MDC7987614.1 DUF2793 domain-containing protein [Rhodoplanes sp. TEM]MDQ0358308.1 hypothetical protein [Rhodoplanes tepidamans]